MRRMTKGGGGGGGEKKYLFLFNDTIEGPRAKGHWIESADQQGDSEGHVLAHLELGPDSLQLLCVWYIKEYHCIVYVWYIKEYYQ
jgi:hypothetical protein